MAKRTKYVTFQGKSKWCNLDIPDTRFSAEGKWNIQQYLNPQSVLDFLELKKEGLRNTLKQDEDGKFVNWNRPTQRMFGKQLKGFSPPDILDREGNPLPRNTRIGYGSDVTTTIEVYYWTTAQKEERCAARLASVRIDNLVPYGRSDLYSKQQVALKTTDKTEPQEQYF